MSNYNLYVVGKKSVLHNDIIIYGVFPNEKYALWFKISFFPMSDIFVVDSNELKMADCGMKIPFTAKKIK